MSREEKALEERSGVGGRREVVSGDLCWGSPGQHMWRQSPPETETGQERLERGGVEEGAVGDVGGEKGGGGGCGAGCRGMEARSIRAIMDGCRAPGSLGALSKRRIS